MATQNDNGMATFVASTDLAAYRFVKLSSTAGQCEYATATNDNVLGVTQVAASSGEPVTVKLRTSPGTFKVEAVNTISISSAVEPGTAGKGTNGSNNKYTAITAGVSGDLIEIIASD